jgi:hypothetical protein
MSAVAVILLSPGPKVFAAYHELITSVALQYEGNDNLRLNAANELSDQIVTVTPKLEVARLSEKYTLRADGRADFYRYREYDVFDDVDQWYNASVSTTPTERWRLGARAHYSEDNRPDRDIDETGLLLRNIQRKRISADASAFYTFSEVVDGGLLLGVNREDFDDPTTSDQRDFFATATVTRNLEDWLVRTTGRLNLGYRRYEFDRDLQRRFTQDIFEVTSTVADRTEVDVFSLTAGTESALTEKFNLLVDLGGRISRSQREVQISRAYDPPLIAEELSVTAESDTGVGFVGGLTVAYRGERSRCDLRLSHDYVPVSGENTAANRTTVRLGGSTRLLENLTGNLFLQWFRNRSDQDDLNLREIDTQTWNAGAGLRWALTDHLDLAGNYTYTVVDDREDGTTAYRNRIILSLEAHYDWLK